MNEMKPVGVDTIQVTIGSIHFPEYEEVKQSALKVAEYVRSMEVTDENVKDAKKVLANANKVVKAIEDRRISIKKEMLKPYDIFETMIKEITGIVKEADNEVRAKVKNLEELERMTKRSEIFEEWEKRTASWDYKKFFTFDDFLTPQHLNKTVTLKTVFEEMEHFIGEKSDDVDFLRTQFGEDYVTEYVQNKGMTIKEVIQKMDERQKLKEIARTIEAYDDFTEETKQVTIFIIEDAKDAILAEMLLQGHDIKFRKEVK